MRLLCLLAACLLAPLVRAADLQPLLERDELRIDSRIEPAGALVPGQRARLELSVATSTWFTGGTRIRVPEVPGLVILQTEQFAANASEVRDGRSWVVQRWTLDVYPQRAGSFTIPPVTLTVQVNAADQGNLSGELTSPAVDFQVAVPDALAGVEQWVAAPVFAVEQAFDRDLSTLAPGDAFERRIVFRGEDVLAMMLPAFTPAPPPGLAAYPAPPKLDNSSNRGRAQASRVQVISYVAEQAGSYPLPGQDFFWWDTRSSSLRVLTLDPVTVTVTGTAAATTGDAGLDPRRVLVFGAALLVAVFAAWLLWRLRPWRWLRLLAGPLARLQKAWASLRRPALPDRLNP